MIRIAEKTRRHTGEPLLPMIDVVFFLVVFFMLTSRFSEPEPFPITPPAAETEIATGDFSLYLNAEGDLARLTTDSSEDEVFRSLAADLTGFCARTDCAKTPPVLLLHADGMASATRVTGLITELAATGFSDIRVVTLK